jgi:hypothetical protein
MNVHFRLFVFGFCAYASNITTAQQGEIEAAYGILGGFVPTLAKFVGIQFSAIGNTTPATLSDVPTPQSPLTN